DYVMEMVHRFYDEYYFRPRAIFRIVRKAAFDSVERGRLYKEAKAFLKLRAQRNRYAKDLRKEQAAASAQPAT
ncbi:MAG: hopanoid biosynthesis associated radical SAM protein HpnJ, partial [Terriglobales bacterium]